jgi:hypothetical protein
VEEADEEVMVEVEAFHRHYRALIPHPYSDAVACIV